MPLAINERGMDFWVTCSTVEEIAPLTTAIKGIGGKITGQEHLVGGDRGPEYLEFRIVNNPAIKEALPAMGSTIDDDTAFESKVAKDLGIEVGKTFTAFA